MAAAIAANAADPLHGLGPLAHMLKNRFYIGEVVYRGEVHPGEQQPILGLDFFEAVQARLAATRSRSQGRGRRTVRLHSSWAFSSMIAAT